MQAETIELERAGRERGHYLCDFCNHAIGLRGWVVVDDSFTALAVCQRCRHERIQGQGSRRH